MNNFIVIEGIDGSGKTTLCLALSQWLEAHNIPNLIVSNPSGTELGTTIKEWFKSPHSFCPRTVFSLFAAAQHELLDKIIIPAINSNKVVICDRYTLSTAAYQLQFIPGAIYQLQFASTSKRTPLAKPTIKSEFLGVLNSYPAPEMQYILQCPWETAKERKSTLDNWEANDRKMRLVARFYEEMYFEHLGPQTKVDATKLPTSVLCNVKRHITAMFKQRNAHRELWEGASEHHYVATTG